MGTVLPMLGPLPFDFILATYNDDNEEYKQIRERYFLNIKQKGLVIQAPVLSLDEQTIFWRVHAPLNVIYDLAEELNEHLPTIQNDVTTDIWYDKPIKRLKVWLDKVDPFKVSNSYFQKPQRYFASNFDKRRLSDFHNSSEPHKLFNQSLRSRLVSYVLENTPFTNYCTSNIGISHLKNIGYYY